MSDLVPIVARMPAVNILPEALFDIKTSKSGSKRSLFGSASNIAYSGPESSDQKYVLAVRDRKTGKFKLVEAPIFEVQLAMKDKQAEEVVTIRQSGVKNYIQRTSLGEAFGTKKAKTAINDRERNKLDADMLGNLEEAIVDTMKDQTANLPSQESRDKAFAADRLIPPHDLETTVVSDVYPTDGIVSAKELALISVDQVEAAKSEEERAQFLPKKDSEFVNSHISRVLSENVNVKPRLKLLVYLSLLLAVYEHRRISDKQKLSTVLGNPPEPLINSIIERYTVSRAGLFGRQKERSFIFDPARVDKLLSYAFVLMLHIDDFQVDVTPLSSEVGLPVTKLVSLFQSLGCVIRTPATSTTKKLGLTTSQAKAWRVAKLKAPLNLPDNVKRRRN